MMMTMMTTMMTTMMLMTRLSVCHIIILVVLISSYIRFKGDVRADGTCRGCAVVIIITTVGDADNAR